MNGLDTIETPRLRLCRLPLDLLRGLLDGTVGEIDGAAVSDEWRQGATPTLRRRIAQIEGAPESAPFLLRAIIDPPAGRVIGRIGFHGPPGANELGAPDALELGYWIEPGSRRCGYAAEAILGMMEWAGTEHAVRRFILSIGPGNAASLGLARKLGFVEIGRHLDDEDGEELVFELRR